MIEKTLFTEMLAELEQERNDISDQMEELDNASDILTSVIVRLKEKLARIQAEEIKKS